MSVLHGLARPLTLIVLGFALIAVPTSTMAEEKTCKELCKEEVQDCTVACGPDDMDCFIGCAKAVKKCLKKCKKQ